MERTKAIIRKIEEELIKRLFDNSESNSFEITLKYGSHKGDILGIYKNNDDNFQVYYFGNKILGTDDCDLIAEFYSLHELAEFISEIN